MAVVVLAWMRRRYNSTASCGHRKLSAIAWGVEQARELMLVQVFVSEATIERFDVCILVPLARLEQP